MKNDLNLNNFLIKASKSHKYSNYTLFSRRETEYSSRIKQKNTSNINSSKQRPYSTSIKKISMKNYKNSNNQLDNQNIPNIFSPNQSKYSINSSKSRTAITRIHTEDYFHKKNKSKMESILFLEKYYTPNTSSMNKLAKIGQNLNTNNYFNDLSYINKIYLTEANIKKPIITKEKKEDFNNFNFDDYNDQIFIDLSKSKNADILKKFNSDK